MVERSNGNAEIKVRFFVGAPNTLKSGGKFMSKKIAILTSGGDCPGLNAAIRGVAKASYGLMPNIDIYGVENGFLGLINGQLTIQKESDFSGILTLGGTIFGTHRISYKDVLASVGTTHDLLEKMIKNYKFYSLDCLVCLGGNGTYKIAKLLVEHGLNVICLPKTIDNDIFGTEISFGFQTAVSIASEVLDRVHTTADSHDRVMIVEVMGHKAGWLALNAGISGGADTILIPEIPFSNKSVLQSIENRTLKGKKFTIIVVAEGAKTKEEAVLSKKDFKKLRQDLANMPISYQLKNYIEKHSAYETRVTIPGHQQRGGTPNSFDRILATKLGVEAAKLILEEHYNIAVSIVNNKIEYKKIVDVAGKTKNVLPNLKLVKTAKLLGISFGE